MEKIRWGILSTGNIAHSFATGLQSAQDAELQDPKQTVQSIVLG